MDLPADDLSMAERADDFMWGYMEEGETYVEKQWAKIKPDDIPIIKTASLALLAFGITSYKELLFGSISMGVYYWTTEGTLDGAILALSGNQFGKGKWKTASFPTLLETYQSYRDFNKGKFMTKTQLMKLFIWMLGFYLGQQKIV
jgi:hypothetical protein